MVSAGSASFCSMAATSPVMMTGLEEPRLAHPQLQLGPKEEEEDHVEEEVRHIGVDEDVGDEGPGMGGEEGGSQCQIVECERGVGDAHKVEEDA